MLLLNPERRRQSLGSAGIHFQWRLWGQQTFLETSLVWTEQTFDCGRNALECKTLQELVMHTQQWDWAVVSCQTRIFTRFYNGYHLGISPDLWDGMSSRDSGEEFGQPRGSFGAQVLQEFHVNVVATWFVIQLPTESQINWIAILKACISVWGGKQYQLTGRYF